MIQGGDPTGTGRGGESIWGKPFKDEVNSKLLHSGRGVVSMANSGPHTNGSQFFILYKSATHLNYKHTVFGGVVGGLTTLAAMEKVPVDDNDRPLVSFYVEHTSFQTRVIESVANYFFFRFSSLLMLDIMRIFFYVIFISSKICVGAFLFVSRQ